MSPPSHRGPAEEPIAALDHVWKRYRLGEGRGLLSWPWSGKGSARDFWSLNDVSLRLAPGDSVGLVGANGAGKTTMLKLLAGISRVTRGQVRTHGRVASLINLGAGFHRELTGRENILLNAVILGLTRREARERLDEIVAFADVGSYLDTPVKQYSSGMYARLGFAVAAYVDPDLLLVDEVLSVGDVEFQDRSLRKMLSFRDAGRAIVFVSHNLSAIEAMCTRCVWLDHGRVRLEGTPPDVVRAYLDAVDAELMAGHDVAHAPADATALRIQRASLHALDGRVAQDFAYGDGLQVRLECHSGTQQRDVGLTVRVLGDYGPLFEAQLPLRETNRAFAVSCTFAHLPLLPGLYHVDVAIRDGSVVRAPETIGAFRVTTDLADYGSASPVGTTKSRGGFLAVPYDWELDSATGRQALHGLVVPERR